MINFKGKKILITGATGGIGNSIVDTLSSLKAKLIVTGTNEKKLEELKNKHKNLIVLKQDISAHQELEAFVNKCNSELGDKIDVLVNNAALTYFLPVRDYPINRWMRSWAVNFHAPFILSQLALEDMIPNGSGSIVNISSGAAIGPGRGPYADVPANSGGTCYGAEKAALERFTQGLAQEVYSDRISVTCVSPSQVVPTPGTVFHNLVTGMDDPRGEHPELMAKAALLLATEPVEKVSGRVTYSQQILKEFGWIDEGKGTGVDNDRIGSGYSQV